MSNGRVGTAVVIYGCLGFAAWAWQFHRGRSAFCDLAVLGGTRAISVPLALSLGALAGVGAAGLSRHLVTRTRWARSLHSALRDALAGLSEGPSTLATLSLAASVGEELFFRGALLPVLRDNLGAPAAVLLSSLLFGAVHVPWSRRLIPWSITAAVMGVVFGCLYLATGEVLAPIAAHAVVNHENLEFLLRWDPERAGPGAPKA